MTRYVLLLLSLFSISLYADYGAGSGDGSSEAQAILIDDADAWKKLAATEMDWGLYFKQIADIDFSSAGEVENIGTFTGTYDGNGHTIHNISIKTDPSFKNANGLFHGNAGVVKNLTVNGATLTGSSRINVNPFP